MSESVSQSINPSINLTGHPSIYPSEQGREGGIKAVHLPTEQSIVQSGSSCVLRTLSCSVERLGQLPGCTQNRRSHALMVSLSTSRITSRACLLLQLLHLSNLQAVSPLLLELLLARSMSSTCLDCRSFFIEFHCIAEHDAECYSKVRSCRLSPLFEDSGFEPVPKLFLVQGPS